MLGDIALAQQVQPVTVMQPILAQPVLQERPSIALALQPELTSAQQQPILQQERPVPEGITLSIQPQPQPSRTFPLLQASDFNSNPADAIFPFFEELAALAPAMQPESVRDLPLLYACLINNPSPGFALQSNQSNLQQC